MDFCPRDCPFLPAENNVAINFKLHGLNGRYLPWMFIMTRRYELKRVLSAKKRRVPDIGLWLIGTSKNELRTEERIQKIVSDYHAAPQEHGQGTETC
jgi:hypothetical protein